VKKLLLTTQQGAHLNLDLTASNSLEMMSCSLVHFFCAMRRRERLAASIYRSQQRVPDRRSNRPQTSCPDKNTHTCMYINRFSRISIGFVCVVMQMCAELQNKKMPVHNEPQIRVGRTNKPLWAVGQRGRRLLVSRSSHKPQAALYSGESQPSSG
jgi:hypothetical protein